MASTRNLTSTETIGQISGAPFDDSSAIQNIQDATISRIVVRFNVYIVSLEVHYNDSQAVIKHGGSSGNVGEVVLEAGEFITIINGIVDGQIIAQLSFATNKERTFGPFGRGRGPPTNQPFVWRAPVADQVPCMGLLYFTGGSDDYINYLSATFARYSARGAQPPSDVKYEMQTNIASSSQTPVGLSSFARTLMSPVVRLCIGPESVQFHAFEDIICRLPFFRAALQGGFREATEKEITMPEDEPAMVSALIEFLCNGSYTYTYGSEAATKISNSETDAPDADLSEGLFHVGVYAIASKYDCQPLTYSAVKSFKYVLNALEGIDVVRLWKAAYSKGLSLSECDEDDDGLVAFKIGLPKLLKELYVTDCEEIEGTIGEYPVLANDFVRLLVSGS